MPATTPVLIRALRQPDEVLELPLPQWERLLREARVCGLGATLALRLKQVRLQTALPDGPRQHLVAAWRQAGHVQRQHGRTLVQLTDLLAPAGHEWALLDVAARAQVGLSTCHPCGLPGAPLRLDLLCLPQRRERLLSLLMRQGWRVMSAVPARAAAAGARGAPAAPPPLRLRHARHGQTVLLHVGVPPGTVAPQLGAEALRSGWQALPGLPGAHLLSAPDLVLSEVLRCWHLSPPQGLLHALTCCDQWLRLHAEQPGFWPALVSRAEWAQQSTTLFLVLRYLRGLLYTPVPDAVVDALDLHAPDDRTLLWQDALVRRCVAPCLPGDDQLAARAARMAWMLARRTPGDGTRPVPGPTRWRALWQAAGAPGQPLAGMACDGG
ncbi:nucleotidyltransferase family protein [Pseudaquabacterium rugosum]|uniref:Nucleotidyltransferase family protein n=1 Tax=Pseudaquabacterium rugosum TaxID=2984194 RepID=A0ABU9B708_9BURK